MRYFAVCLTLCLSLIVSSGCSASEGASTAPVIGSPATMSVSGNLSFTAIGDSVRLAITVFDGKGNVVPNAFVSAYVLPVGIVTIGSNGYVRATTSGRAIAFLSAGDASMSVPVVVNQTPVRIKVSRDTLRFGALGGFQSISVTLQDRNGFPLPEFEPLFSWSSENSQIATVDPFPGANGPSAHVYPKANGTTAVRVSSGQLTARFVTIVEQVAKYLYATPLTVTLRVGQSQQYLINALDEAGNVIANPVLLWTSLNPDLVQVDATGRVTALAKGTATVAVRSGSASTSVLIFVQ